MDDFTEHAFANRDEPIPVIRLDPADDLFDEADDTPHKEGTRERMRRHAAALKENVRRAQDKAEDTKSSIQDRFVEKSASNRTFCATSY